MLWFNFLEDYGCVLGYAEWIKYRFIEIPIITIKEVSHGTDNDTRFEEPQQHYGNKNSKSNNRDSNHHDHRGISWY